MEEFLNEYGVWHREMSFFKPWMLLKATEKKKKKQYWVGDIAEEKP